MKFIYEIDGQRLASNTQILMLKPYQVEATEGYKLREIAQVVRPPRNYQGNLRELWEAGETYFPTLWVTAAKILIDPVVVIKTKPGPYVVPAHIKKQFDKNYQTASHIALLDIDSRLETLAVRYFPVTAPPGAKLIGVYHRCST
jgi:hypothetical protein